MNSYKWSVKSIATLPSPPAPIDDFATSAIYIVTATNKDNPSITVSIENMVIFSLPETEDIDFIPFNQLTEIEIINWIQSEPNLVVNIQANLDGQIQTLMNPPIAPEETPLPWESK
jgi:hypothetical protein